MWGCLRGLKQPGIESGRVILEATILALRTRTEARGIQDVVVYILYVCVIRCLTGYNGSEV